MWRSKPFWGLMIFVLLGIVASIYIDPQSCNTSLLGGVLAGLITLFAMWFIDDRQADRWKNDIYYKQYYEDLNEYEKLINDISQSLGDLRLNESEGGIVEFCQKSTGLLPKFNKLENKYSVNNNKYYTFLKNYIMVISSISYDIHTNLNVLVNNKNKYFQEEFIRLVSHVNLITDSDLDEFIPVKDNKYTKEQVKNSFVLLCMAVLDKIDNYSLRMKDIFEYKKI